MKFMFIIFSLVYAGGELSNGYDNSINLSFSNLVDNQTYTLIQNEDEEVLDLKPKLKNLKFNIVFKSKYELGFEYQYSSSFINAYNLPYRGSYNFLYFKYHFKEREKFPLNMSFNLKYGESASFRSNDNYIFNIRSFGVSIYKEFDDFKYPLLPIITYQKVNSYINEISKFDYSIVEFDFFIKIIVDNIDNDRRRDVIFLGPKISSIDNDQSVGFTVGLHHPFK